MDLFNLGPHPVGNAFWQWCVVELLRQGLAALHHPTKKVGKDFDLVLVTPLNGDEQPGEAADGIGIFSGRIGDGYTKVSRHLFYRSSRGGGGIQTCLDKLPGGILD